MSVFAKPSHEQAPQEGPNNSESAAKLLEEISALLSSVDVSAQNPQDGGKRGKRHSKTHKSSKRSRRSKKSRSKKGSKRSKSGSRHHKRKRELNPFMKALIELKRYIKAEIGDKQELKDVGAFAIAASNLLKKHDVDLAKAKAGFNATAFIKAYKDATNRPKKPRKSRKSKSVSD